MSYCPQLFYQVRLTQYGEGEEKITYFKSSVFCNWISRFTITSFHVGCEMLTWLTLVIRLAFFSHVATQESTAAPGEETTAVPPGKTPQTRLQKAWLMLNPLRVSKYRGPRPEFATGFCRVLVIPGDPMSSWSPSSVSPLSSSMFLSVCLSSYSDQESIWERVILGNSAGGMRNIWAIHFRFFAGLVV